MIASVMESVIKPVSYADILRAPNAQELIDAYASECSIPEIGEACPQSDMYAMLEEAGMMQAFGVYRDDKLIGFATVMVSVLPHYGKRIATIESIFIAKEFRDGATGRGLMETVESFAAQLECEAVLYSSPLDSRFDRFLSCCAEYRHTNNVYCRRLN